MITIRLLHEVGGSGEKLYLNHNISYINSLLLLMDEQYSIVEACHNLFFCPFVDAFCVVIIYRVTMHNLRPIFLGPFLLGVYLEVGFLDGNTVTCSIKIFYSEVALMKAASERLWSAGPSHAPCGPD
jgi:hypothetical protein